MQMRMAEPQPFSKVTSHTPEQAYEKVLQYAGASLRRDIIDQRIVKEVREGTSTWTGSKDEKPRPGIIDTVGDTEGYPEVKSLKAWPDTDGDGIPDIWEEAYGLDPNNPDDAAQISTSVDPTGVIPIWKFIFITWFSILFTIRIWAVRLSRRNSKPYIL